MQHECRITVLEQRYFRNCRKNIWQIQSQDHVHVLRLEIPSF